MATSIKNKSWFFYFLVFLGIGLLSLVALALWAYKSLPTTDNINECFTTSMFSVELCPKKSSYVRTSQIPKHVILALIASEDASFYFHKGFDWDEIEDSLEKSLDAGRWVRGGSTLTQQLAKNLYLNSEKSLLRKMKEFFIAQKIEKKLSKTQIIEKYLNVVEFGKKIYGIKAAASYYFQKSPAELTPAEGAYLISLLPNPVKYSRAFTANKELSRYNRGRVLRILSLLKLQNKISEEEYYFEVARVENGLWYTPPATDPYGVPSISDIETPSFDTSPEESPEESTESPTVDEYE